MQPQISLYSKHIFPNKIQKNLWWWFLVPFSDFKDQPDNKSVWSAVYKKAIYRKLNGLLLCLGLQRDRRSWCCVWQDGSRAGAFAAECALQFIWRTGAKQQPSVQPARPHRVPYVGPTHPWHIAHHHTHPEGMSLFSCTF